MLIKSGDVILFQGDSITDCGRNRENPNDLGKGYSLIVASLLMHHLRDYNLTFLNRGIGGNRVCDLEQRWEEDCINLKPTVISILIGINEVWRRYGSNDPTDANTFETGYRNILSQVKTELGARIVLLEPFLNPYPDDRRLWREDLEQKLDVVRRLASEFNAVLVPLDKVFVDAYKVKPGAYYANDGIHPSCAGHGMIAEEWLRAVGYK